MHLKPNLASELRECLVGVVQLVIETIDVHCARMVVLVTSVSDALKLDSPFIIDGLCLVECSDTASSANHDLWLRHVSFPLNHFVFL